YEVVGNAALVVAQASLIGLFFRRSRAFPGLYIVVVAANTSFLLIDNFWSQVLGLVEPHELVAAWGQMVGGMIGAAIWITYFCVSRRVRNTFVR
ncbi:MAG TPA: DUF2569 family protein, partial [Candidatus Synoicihabitans sp.]|nr:DUF2569 family protein [Candidatus Synoicihabitans sp.]